MSTKGKLDRTTPYAQIVNDPEGRAFEQDGAYFTAGGDAWTDPAAPAPAHAHGSAKKKAAATDDTPGEPS